MLLQDLFEQYKDEDAIPSKYLKGLRGKDKEAREREILRRSKESHKDPDSYRPFRTSKNVETKPSKYNAKFQKMYGDSFEESYLLEESKFWDGVKDKAKKAGIPLGIAKQVVKRGMAAWRTGHRPGATSHAWGIARLNSFATGGKTSKTADKDLYKKWKSS